eukprot:903228-Pyramimonas_sp.AAC.1
MQLLGALGLCEALLSYVGAIADGGALVEVFWLRSGFIQGCGLSSSLRAFASAPMLQDLEANPEGGGRVPGRACADDLGVVLF